MYVYVISDIMYYFVIPKGIYSIRPLPPLPQLCLYIFEVCSYSKNG